MTTETLVIDNGPEVVFLDLDVPPVTILDVTGPPVETLTVDNQHYVVEVEEPDIDDVVLIAIVAGPEGPEGPPGPGSGTSAHFTYHQVDAAASWMVTHNLGRKPPVALFLDSDPDTVVHTDVYYPDLNTVLIEWPSPESGWVYL